MHVACSILNNSSKVYRYDHLFPGGSFDCSSLLQRNNLGQVKIKPWQLASEMSLSAHTILYHQLASVISRSSIITFYGGGVNGKVRQRSQRGSGRRGKSIGWSILEDCDP